MEEKQELEEKQEFHLQPYGLNETIRLTVPEAEQVLYKPYICLDHGFVRLIDYMGGDSSIVQAARVSYGKGTKKINTDTALIRYLMRHEHTTPFEMVELKFHAKMPIFVARQWIRHRTANVNEYSGRYSILNNEFYIPKPEDLGVQSLTERQGKGGPLDQDKAMFVLNLLKEDSVKNYEHYEKFLGTGLARELARIGLSLNFYTEWYWKIDLHNLFHFLKLRKDRHAQEEIRVYADAMGDITRKVASIAYSAFEDYKLNSKTFSGLECEVLSEIIHEGNVESELATIYHAVEEAHKSKAAHIEYKGTTWWRGELSEFGEKLQSIAMIKNPDGVER